MSEGVYITAEEAEEIKDKLSELLEMKLEAKTRTESESIFAENLKSLREVDEEEAEGPEKPSISYSRANEG